MNKGTLVAIAGCVLTLAALAGIVTWAQSLLPRDLRHYAQSVGNDLRDSQSDMDRLAHEIKSTLEAHPAILGPTAKEEGWSDLVMLAKEDMDEAYTRHAAEVLPILKANDREDEERLEALLEELLLVRKTALDSVEELRTRVRELAKIVQRATRLLAKVKQHLEELGPLASSTKVLIGEFVAGHPDAQTMARGGRWVESCESVEGIASTLLQEHRTLSKQLQAGKVEVAKTCLAQLDAIDKRRGKALAPLASLRKRVEGLKDFLDRKDEYVQRAKEDADAIQMFPVAPLQERAKAAAERYASNQAEILRRSRVADRIRLTGQELGASVVSMANLPLAEINPQKLYAQSKRLNKLRTTGVAQLQALSAQLDQLDSFYEKVLVDMEIKEGYEVTFHQEMLEVRGGTKLTTRNTRGWHKVSEAAYKKLEAYLGMSVHSKPLGYFDDQARKKIHVAGMPYVNLSTFGAWEESPKGEGARWSFSPQAAALQAAFWHEHYRPVSRAELDGFQTAHGVWLGTDPWGHVLYGSTGSLTLKIYAASKFVRANGYKSTRYKRSGGRFKGTRYERKPRRTTVVVGGGSSSRRSRGTRSWGSSRRSWGK
jgi:hypothetical protein